MAKKDDDKETSNLSLAKKIEFYNQYIAAKEGKTLVSENRLKKRKLQSSKNSNIVNSNKIKFNTAAKIDKALVFDNGLKKRKFSSSKNLNVANSNKIKFNTAALVDDNNTNSKNLKLRVKLLSNKAKKPKKGANGYDIYSACNTIFPAYGEGIVNTDVVIGLPEETYGYVVSVNGLEVKKFIGCNEDSPGPITVYMYNNSEAEFEVKEGDLFANLVICCTPDVIECNEFYKRDKLEK